MAVETWTLTEFTTRELKIAQRAMESPCLAIQEKTWRNHTISQSFVASWYEWLHWNVNKQTTLLRETVWDGQNLYWSVIRKTNPKSNRRPMDKWDEGNRRIIGINCQNTVQYSSRFEDILNWRIHIWGPYITNERGHIFNRLNWLMLLLIPILSLISDTW